MAQTQQEDVRTDILVHEAQICIKDAASDKQSIQSTCRYLRSRLQSMDDWLTMNEDYESDDLEEIPEEKYNKLIKRVRDMFKESPKDIDSLVKVLDDLKIKKEECLTELANLEDTFDGLTLEGLQLKERIQGRALTVYECEEEYVKKNRKYVHAIHMVLLRRDQGADIDEIHLLADQGNKLQNMMMMESSKFHIQLRGLKEEWKKWKMLCKELESVKIEVQRCRSLLVHINQELQHNEELFGVLRKARMRSGRVDFLFENIRMRENYTSEEEEELQNLVENGIVTTKDILESSPLLQRTRTNAQITNKLKNMKKKRKREAHKHFAKSVARMRREWLIEAVNSRQDNITTPSNMDGRHVGNEHFTNTVARMRQGREWLKEAVNSRQHNNITTSSNMDGRHVGKSEKRVAVADVTPKKLSGDFKSITHIHSV